MADYVTRRYVNRVDGTPITGAKIRLKNAMFPNEDPYVMTGIPGVDTETKGYYYATTVAGGAPAAIEGVYYVERDFLDGNGYVSWEGEETVGPKRLYRHGSQGSLIDPILNSQMRAAAILPDGGAGTMERVDTAIDVCVVNGGSKRLIVGSHGSLGENKTWAGAGAGVPDGVVLDLAGATLSETDGTNASILSCAGDITVMNGNLKINSTDGLGRVVTMSDASKRGIFIGVTFERPGTAAPTVAGTTNQECPAIFIGCKNVVLAPPAAADSSTRKQCAIGCTGVYEVGGAVAVQLDQANVNGTHLGDLVQTALKAAVVTPDAGLPITDMKEFAEIVKYMWNTQIPALVAKDDDLQDQIDVATVSSGTSWSWSRSVAADAVWEVTPVGGSGAVGVPSIRTCYQNAYVRGTGNNAVLVLQCAAVFKVLLSAGVPFMGISGSITIDLAAFEAALAVKYPGWGLSGVASLRYSEGGRAFGFYFKKAFKAFALESYLVANRMPWSQIPLLDGDGDGPSALKFCSSTAPFVQKGVKFTIPPQSIAIGSTIAAVSFELEIPATQTSTHSNDGALGTIIDLPYLL